jgi:hypothetical protein
LGSRGAVGGEVTEKILRALEHSIVRRGDTLASLEDTTSRHTSLHERAASGEKIMKKRIKKMMTLNESEVSNAEITSRHVVE